GDWSGQGAVRGTGGLLLLRVLAALSTLAIGITSLVAVTSASPPSGLRWFLYLPPPPSLRGYKTEMIILIVLGAICLLAFMSRTTASRALAIFPAVGLIAILVINIVNLNEPHQLITYLLSQKTAIAVWVCLGLALIAAGTVAWSEATSAQLFGVFIAGAVVTGVAVAIVASSAPSFGDDFGLNSGQIVSGGSSDSSQFSNGDSFGDGDSASSGDGVSNGDGLDSEGDGDTGLSSDNSPGECADQWTSELDVVTASLHATICEAPDGDDDLSLSGSDIALVNLPASYDGSSWSADDGNGDDYDVTPDEITVSDDGSVENDEYTSDSEQNDATESPGVNGTSRLAIQEMLVSFHEDVVNRDFQAAFNLLSPRVQQIQLRKYGYVKWRQAQASLSPYLEPAGLHVTMRSYDPGTGVALVMVTGMGWTAPNYTCSQWRGLTWVRYQNGQWRYEPGYSITRQRAREWKSHFNELLGGSCHVR
ncbi:MAG TPA: hypothetical protein VHW74_09235, partial [Mycobacteriales bacterium]|nr:hypothetical protein [Mycobacteriales bacterium]